MSYLVPDTGQSRLPTFAVIIPAFNEEAVIEGTLTSVLGVGFPWHSVYVVDDRSTDSTADLARKFGVNVLTLEKNSGKAGATKQLLAHYSVLERYNYVILLDADSILNSDFLTCLQAQALEKPTTALFVGQVKSRHGNYITSYRAMEYTFGHDFYKSGQANFNLIYVAPGCAAIYRSSTLAKLDIEGDTLAEDMDLTLQVHRRKGRVEYAPEIIVHTQDPGSLRDLTKQVTRWQRGTFQVMRKHGTFNPLKKKQWIDGYMALIILEALIFNRVFVIGSLAWLVSIPFALKLLALDVLVLFGIAVYSAVKASRPDIIRRFPLYWWIPYFMSLITLKSFVEVFILRQAKLNWNKVKRYA